MTRFLEPASIALVLVLMACSAKGNAAPDAGGSAPSWPMQIRGQ